MNFPDRMFDNALSTVLARSDRHGRLRVIRAAVGLLDATFRSAFVAKRNCGDPHRWPAPSAISDLYDHGMKLPRSVQLPMKLGTEPQQDKQPHSLLWRTPPWLRIRLRSCSLLQVRCLTASGRPWLRIGLRFGLITLTKPNHSSSKPIDDPREVRLTKLRSYRFKDILRHVFEIDIRRRAFGAELFQDVANSAYRGIKILLSQFSRYRSYDALCQIRHFSWHIEGCIH
jgi:hypothetical protein